MPPVSPVEARKAQAIKDTKKRFRRVMTDPMMSRICECFVSMVLHRLDNRGTGGKAAA